jgi:hypothetical protein
MHFIGKRRFLRPRYSQAIENRFSDKDWSCLFLSVVEKNRSLAVGDGATGLLKWVRNELLIFAWKRRQEVASK